VSRRDWGLDSDPLSVSSRGPSGPPKARLRGLTAGDVGEVRTAECDWRGWKKNGESCPAMGDVDSAS